MTDRRPPVPATADWSSARARLWATGVGGLGTAAWIVGFVLHPAQASHSYLTAYVFVLGIALGALALLMIEHLVAATWFVVLRRLVEHLTALIPALAVLFLPIAAGVRWLYPWTDPAALAPHARELVERKEAYLNLPFFFVRAALYFASWIALAALLRRWSLRQDGEPGERWQAPQRALSAPGAIVLAFTLTFAAFDWIMSLEPTWMSTIFGVQIFAGGMVGTLALLAVLAGRAADGGPLTGVLNDEHFAALGKLLFTFVIFWAYTTFAQLLIVWIADLPDEVIWYLARLNGPWRWVGLAVAVGQFAVPFFLLLSHRLKRQPRLLVALGASILVVHYIETWWIVMPQLQPMSAVPHWTDAAAAAMVVGLAGAWASRAGSGHSAVAVGDPALPAALEYSEL